MEEEIEKRKLDGIHVCLTEEVEARKITTCFEYVQLIHCALPELDLEEVDTSTTFLDHKFSAPILIDAMTGGAPAAQEINRTLGEAAQELNLGMAVGSQRAGLLSERLAKTYAEARKAAPTTFIAANIGGAQLSRGLALEETQELIKMIDADALVIHLNPLQEVIQPEGEPCYKNVLGKISEITSKLKVPVIVKETGAGISREVAIRLELAGVSAINVSGAGGTSWAAAEHYRARTQGNWPKAMLGEVFWDWGIPTAAALLEVGAAVKIPVISSGGLRTGLDIAKSLVLGASLCGMALPLLRQAVVSKNALVDFLRKTIMELSVAMFLVGAGNTKALRDVRYVLTGPLAREKR